MDGSTPSNRWLTSTSTKASAQSSSPSKLTHTSLGESRIHLAALYLIVDVSKEGWGAPCQGGGHLPTLAYLKLAVQFQSLLQVHEIKGIRLKFGSLHAESVLGLRLLVFLYKERLLEFSIDGSFVVELL